MKKLDIEFVRYHFEKEGYSLLSDVYTSCDSKLEYRCPNGHLHSISWSNWKSGYRCFHCFNNNRKIDMDTVRQGFISEGYELLSNVYINSKNKLKYKCPNGHIHKISWADWNSGGRRCPYCSGNIKPTVEFIRNQFMREGYILLTNNYRNNKQKLHYICPVGHKGSVSWRNWNGLGNRCFKCFHIKYSGDNHPRWNNCATPFYRRIRYFISCKKWPQDVFYRDKYICQKCDLSKSGELNAHHIIPLNDIINYYNLNNMKEVRKCKLIIDVNNGITLCRNCHEWVHSNSNTGNIFLGVIPK